MSNEARLLREGGVGVLATDTLYGVVAAAENEAAVERVYALKKRTPTKPVIILIASPNDLSIFGIDLSPERRERLMQYWPGPTSVVLPCGAKVPEYLHRGTHTLAFRLPDNQALQAFLKESGPIIAPSANPEGLEPATTIEEAKAYFGAGVDFYIDSGERTGEPSTLISLDEQGEVTVLRKGRQ